MHIKESTLHPPLPSYYAGSPAPSLGKTWVQACDLQFEVPYSNIQGAAQITNHKPDPNFFPASPASRGFFKKLTTCLIETPAEAIAFAIAAAVVRIFVPALCAPLLGIGAAIFVTKLVLKISSCYNSKLLINLTKEACKLNRKYPKLQLITFIFVIAISFLCTTLGVALGIALGSFGAVILDVENYKLIQQATRKQNKALLAIPASS